MKRKDFLIILVLLFIFVIAWIAGNIYHSIATSTISNTTNQDISPISPAFDTKTVDKLRQRQKVNPVFELSNTAPTPTPFPLEILSPPESSEEARLILP
ncbi:MAG: hypothetical protein HYW62_03680 [Candidatus Levybacteria bacterium]|nr:hypothetical protein [Candidatus Levybacteria bacterium]